MTEDSRQFIVDIILIVFALDRTNQLSLLPDKDVVDLCHPLEPYQVTKNQYFTQFIPGKQEGYGTTTESLPTSLSLAPATSNFPKKYRRANAN